MDKPKLSRKRVGANTTLHLQVDTVNYREGDDDIFDGRIIWIDVKRSEYMADTWEKWAADKNNIYLFATHNEGVQ